MSVAKVGFSPELREFLARMIEGMQGDFVIVATPATLATSVVKVAAAIAGSSHKFKRTIEITVQDAAGNIHEWFSGTFAIAASKNSTSGVIAIAGAASTITLDQGYATVELDYTGTWAQGDTATLTVTGGTLMGNSISNKTSVDTLAA